MNLDEIIFRVLYNTIGVHYHYTMSRCTRMVLCCCFCLISLTSLHAGSHFFRFHGITQDLPSMCISSIVQDSRGFLWFGTQAGLVMYDGHEYITHTAIPFAKNTLSSNLIQTMFMDKNDVLWVGSYAGLDRYDIPTDTFTHYSVGSDVVVSLLKDSRGRLWAGTLDGLGCLVPGATTFIEYSKESTRFHIGNNTVRNLYEDTSGRIYACTYDGLWEYDAARDFFRPSHLIQPGNPAEKGTTYDIRQDASGDFWIARWSVGLIRVSADASSYKVFPLADNRIYCMNTSFDPNLVLAGTWGGGLNVLDKTTGAVSAYTEQSPSGQRLTNDIVYSMFVDRNGLLWLGTNGGGLNLHDPAHSWFSSIDASSASEFLPSGKISGILRDDSGDLWIAVSSKGLTRYSIKNNTFRNYHTTAEATGALPASAVYCLYQDSHGTLYAGTDRGPMTFDPRSDSFSRPDWTLFMKMNDGSLKISSITETKDGSLWFGTWEDGCYRYFPGTKKHMQYTHVSADSNSLSDNLVYFIKEDHTGLIWIGTNKGLNRYDPATGKMIGYYYDHENLDGVSSNTMYCCYENPDGTLWFATRNGGVCVWHPDTGKFTHITSADGLPSDTVVGICPSRNRFLWLATQNGLVRYEMDRKTIFVYRTSDGLLSQQFNTAWFSPNDDLRFFGTPLGIVWFSEADVMQGSTAVPGVSVTSIMVNNQRIPVPYASDAKMKFTLKSDQRNISIGYTPLDFSPLSRYTCSYMLEGFDSEWIQAGTRNFAMYTNLNPGTYRFLIHVDGQNPVSGAKEATIEFTILKPIYLRWYALLLYVGVLISLGFMIFRMWKSLLLERKVGELEATASDLQSANVQLEHLSYHDPLTGIPNRRSFEYSIIREWDAALTCKDYLSILMIDIDFFKTFNDTFGHVEGDKALRSVASSLCNALFRVSDMVARYGGEEFVIILPDTNSENAGIVCGRLMAALEETHIPFASAISDHLTISIGCYTGIPSSGITFDKFVQRADEALYQSKNSGRNRYSIYTTANYEL